MHLPLNRSSFRFSVIALAVTAVFAFSIQPVAAQSRGEQPAPRGEQDGRNLEDRSVPRPGATREHRHKTDPADPGHPQSRAGDGAKPFAPPGAGIAGQARKTQSADTPEARARALSDLYAHLAAAADTGEASAIASAIEVLWIHSGSDTVALLLSRATEAIAAKRSDLAHSLLDAVVELAPDFAEGFARRAFLFYTENDTTRALGDLRRALALDPNHYRALDGLVTILKDIGEKRAALQALKQLQDVHPFWPGLEENLRELERAVEGQGI